MIKKMRLQENASLTRKRITDTITEVDMNTQLELTRNYISSEVRFYTVRDVMELTGWSEQVVLKMFNDPRFPSADFGKAKIVETHALIEYFSTKRSRETEPFWKKGDLRNELRRRAG